MKNLKKKLDKRKIRIYRNVPEVGIGQRDLVFLVIFSLLALQMFMGYLQVRQYQKAVKKWLGKGILGMGQRRGLLKPGELLILVYDRKEDRAVSVQSMKGYTVFARFEDKAELKGLPLKELRRIGIERDIKEMGWYRRRHPYDPLTLSKKKGALIQAVEAVDRYIRKQEALEEEKMQEDLREIQES